MMMSDLEGLFRREMLASRTTRLAGEVISTAGGWAWTAIAVCAASFLLLLGWAATTDYSTGRIAPAFVLRAGGPHRQPIVLSMSMSALGFIHEGQSVGIFHGGEERVGRIANVAITSQDRRTAAMRQPSPREGLVVYVRLAGAGFSDRLPAGREVSLKAISRSKPILSWIVGE